MQIMSLFVLHFSRLHNIQTLKSILWWGSLDLQRSPNLVSSQCLSLGKISKACMRNLSDYAKLSIALNKEKIRAAFLGLYHTNLNLGPRT